jgi:hypothetical protein
MSVSVYDSIIVSAYELSTMNRFRLLFVVWVEM